MSGNNEFNPCESNWRSSICAASQVSRGEPTDVDDAPASARLHLYADDDGKNMQMRSFSYRTTE